MATGSDQNGDERSMVRSLLKGLSVLECFTAERPELTLSEVSLDTGMDPGTTFRLLNTLCSAGYVRRRVESKRYCLTLKVLGLGFDAIGRTDLRTLARPLLRSLVGDGAEAASIGVLDGPNVVFVERVHRGHARMGIDLHVGSRLPADRTAIGQALIAFLPQDERRQLLAMADQRVPYAGGDPDPVDLEARLAEVKVKRWICWKVPEMALLTLAVPVLDADGMPVCAISISAPALAISREDLIESKLGPTIEAAAQLEQAMRVSGAVVSGPASETRASRSRKVG